MKKPARDLFADVSKIEQAAFAEPVIVKMSRGQRSEKCLPMKSSRPCWLLHPQRMALRRGSLPNIAPKMYFMWVRMPLRLKPDDVSFEKVGRAPNPLDWAHRDVRKRHAHAGVQRDALNFGLAATQ